MKCGACRTHYKEAKGTRMNRIVFVAALIVAGTLSAEEVAKNGTAAAKDSTKPATTSAKPAVAPAAAPATDSPLVRAAKRSGAKKSTKKVITNETVKENQGGHITTTKTQTSVVTGPDVTPEKSDVEKAAEEASVKKQREAAVEKLRQEEEQKRQDRLRRAAAATEEGDAWMDGDPAAAEELQRTAAEPKKP